MTPISKFLKRRAFFYGISPRCAGLYENMVVKRIQEHNEKRISKRVALSDSLFPHQKKAIDSNIGVIAKIAERFGVKFKFTRREDDIKRPFRVRVFGYKPNQARCSKTNCPEEIPVGKIVLNDKQPYDIVESLRRGLGVICETLEERVRPR